MNDREQRGLALAALYRIDKAENGAYLVPSQSGNGQRYEVRIDTTYPECSCRDYRDRAVKCKHMFAVEFVVHREKNPDGSVTVEKSVTLRERVTYRQNWPAYNAAQTNEKARFQVLLHELCRDLPTPPVKGRGKQQAKMPDVVFAAVFKVFSTMSGRRFEGDLEAAAGRGFLTRVPKYNTVFKYLRSPDLTPILHRFIAESARPLRSVETDFAVDSSGFSTCRFTRWFDVKYGKTMEEQEWVKVHLMCGVKTNVVTAVEILDKHANDSPQLPALVRATARDFAVREVSADKAYASRANMEAVAEVGGTPYIAFKDTHTGGVGGMFAKSYHFYCLNRDKFLEHYHKRSNVESTFSMIKAKFGDSVRSKCDAGMRNEALCKILCHNLCCLVQSHYELGIEADFWGKAEAEAEQARIGDAHSVDEVAEAWAWV